MLAHFNHTLRVYADGDMQIPVPLDSSENICILLTFKPSKFDSQGNSLSDAKHVKCW